MEQVLDIDSWNRKEHFNFFKNFDEPFFGFTTEICCNRAYRICKKKNYSFFLYYLHATLIAANEVENFRYRIVDDQVLIYDVIHASSTVGRKDGTFGFSFMEYFENYEKFEEQAKLEINRIERTPGLDPGVAGDNVIHFSSIPWINFTSLSHARSFTFKSSCPKISYGRMTDQKGIKFMPISVHVHHALMDARHVGQFLDKLKSIL